MTISTLDIAWAAGFFEGEAAFQSQRRSPAISVSQKQKEPLERLLKLFGGNLCFTGKNKISAGKVRDGYWKWAITGYRAAGLIMTVFGLLSPRRQEQAGNALKLWRETMPSAGGRTTREQCFRGHRWTPENTYFNERSGKRRCRACYVEWNKGYVIRPRAGDVAT